LVVNERFAPEDTRRYAHTIVNVGLEAPRRADLITARPDRGRRPYALAFGSSCGKSDDR
jgi:hypothetical protein